MPIYEYQCQECGKRTEAIQRYDDAPLTTCPQCNGPLKKLISSPAFQFKGSGWYVTDYARGSSGGGNGEKSSSGQDGAASGSDAKETAKDSAKEAAPAPSPKAAEAKGGD